MTWISPRSESISHKYRQGLGLTGSLRNMRPERCCGQTGTRVKPTLTLLAHSSENVSMSLFVRRAMYLLLQAVSIHQPSLSPATTAASFTRGAKSFVENRHLTSNCGWPLCDDKKSSGVNNPWSQLFQGVLLNDPLAHVPGVSFPGHSLALFAFAEPLHGP